MNPTLTCTSLIKFTLPDVKENELNDFCNEFFPPSDKYKNLRRFNFKIDYNDNDNNNRYLRNNENDSLNIYDDEEDEDIINEENISRLLGLHKNDPRNVSFSAKSLKHSLYERLKTFADTYNLDIKNELREEMNIVNNKIKRLGYDLFKINNEEIRKNSLLSHWYLIP